MYAMEGGVQARDGHPNGAYCHPELRMTVPGILLSIGFMSYPCSRGSSADAVTSFSPAAPPAACLGGRRLRAARAACALVALGAVGAVHERLRAKVAGRCGDAGGDAASTDRALAGS